MSLITLISVFIFENHLNLQEYIGLGLALLGIILVNLGEEHSSQNAKEERNV